MPATPRGVRRLLVSLLTAALIASVLAVSASSAGAQPREQVLTRDMHGEEAIQALGDRLPSVAAQNDMSPAEFRGALREDSMLWVGRTGQLLFVDQLEFGGDHAAEHGATADSAWTSAAMPSGTDVFQLESRPGAARVIVLDFNGHDARGTAWGNGGRQIAGAYDSDGDPSTFSQTEQEQIYSVWQRVAEDYAPFDVNVTTRDFPHVAYQNGHAAIRRDDTSDQNYGTRVAITPSQPYSCRCGGVAYVGVFPRIGADHDYYQPAWVFTGGVGNGAKNIAEAVSHEAGHNLQLRHDGTSSSGYYTGHGDWAPIMGVGYYEPITQWSKGEYSGANNKEDDLVVMQMHDAANVARGILPAADAPSSLVESSTTGILIGEGLIGLGGDVDQYTFTVGTSTNVALAATPAAVSANLDLRMKLLHGTSTLATVDPVSSASEGNDISAGLDATLSIQLDAGEYTVVLDGVGFGDPKSDGYSSYGSMGRYTLTVDLTGSGGDGGGGGGGTEDPEPPPTSEPNAPSDPSATAATDGSITVGWLDNADNETGFEIQREFLHKNGSWRGTTTLTAGQNATSYRDEPGSGTFRYRVRAVNATGDSAYTDWVQDTVSGGGGGKPTKGNNGKGSQAIVRF